MRVLPVVVPERVVVAAMTLVAATALGGCRQHGEDATSGPCPDRPSQGTGTRAPRITIAPPELHPGDPFTATFTRWEPRDTMLSLNSIGSGGNRCGENYLIYT